MRSVLNRRLFSTLYLMVTFLFFGACEQGFGLGLGSADAQNSPDSEPGSEPGSEGEPSAPGGSPSRNAEPNPPPQPCLGAGNLAGEGTAASPYIIDDLSDIQVMNIPNCNDKHYRLVKNLDHAGVSFTPIGIFKGVLDGGDYTISGVEVAVQSGYQAGFFAGLGPGAQVKNLRLSSLRIGFGNGEDLEVPKAVASGGLVAQISGRGTVLIENTHVEGRIAGQTYAGGLIGSIRGNGPESIITIRNSSSSGSVLSNSGFTGGFIGSISPEKSTVEILNSQSSADVRGDYYTGGFIGNILGQSGGIARVTSSEASGTVSGDTFTGGFAGALHTQNSTIIIENSNTSASVCSRSTFTGGFSGSVVEQGGELKIVNSQASGDIASVLQGVGQDGAGVFIADSSMSSNPDFEVINSAGSGQFLPLGANETCN